MATRLSCWAVTYFAHKMLSLPYPKYQAVEAPGILHLGCETVKCHSAPKDPQWFPCLAAQRCLSHPLWMPLFSSRCCWDQFLSLLQHTPREFGAGWILPSCERFGYFFFLIGFIFGLAPFQMFCSAVILFFFFFLCLFFLFLHIFYGWKGILFL